MSSKIFGPHKRRTREHVIADLGVHHVEGFILEEGHTFEEFRRDYGYDIMMTTFDENGFAEPGRVYFQVKAFEHLREAGADCVYDLDIRDYNFWMIDPVPVILVLYDAVAGCAYWVSIKRYFMDAENRQPKKGAKSIRIRIPTTARLNRGAIAELRRQKSVRTVT